MTPVFFNVPGFENDMYLEGSDMGITISSYYQFIVLANVNSDVYYVFKYVFLLIKN